MTNDKKLRTKDNLIVLALFLLALAVRVPALNGFITIDEPYWVARSRFFTAGLFFPDYNCPPEREGRSFETTGLGCTFQAGFPAVTTMWAGALGLLTHYWQSVAPLGIDFRSYLDNLSPRPLDASVIAPTRWYIAILNALFAPAFYSVLRRLLSRRTALIAALLITLNPFHIALSRVLHHDALTTSFMMLSSLTMIGYWLDGKSRRWLTASAVFAGGGFLTKPISWFLIPYALLMGALSVVYHRQQNTAPNNKSGGRRILRRLVSDWALWALIAGLTFTIFFPAMWVYPQKVLSGIFQVSVQFAREGHFKGQYFMGQVSRDPGMWYYPVGWLFRASPLEMLGLLALPFAIRRAFQSRQANSARRFLFEHPVETALALFLIAFWLFENASNKKNLRYFLPAFPVLAIFAAQGLLWLGDQFSRLSGIRNRTLLGLATITILTQGWLVFQNYPTYFTYYNPLLGGAPAAAKIITVFGWGDMMAEAAVYLNQQPESESLRVISWYNQALMPFLNGKAHDFSSKTGNVMDSDYLIYHRNQLQRNLQNQAIWRYFDQHYSPVHRVSRNELDYLLIYRNPIQQHLDWKENSLPDIFTVFGYTLYPDGNLTLFWQNLGLKDGQTLYLGLTPANGGQTVWANCTVNPNFATDAKANNALLESQCAFSSSDFAAGVYNLTLSWGKAKTITPLDFPAGRLAISIGQDGVFTVLDPVTAVKRLAAQSLPKEAIPARYLVGDIAWLSGYQLQPGKWQPGQNVTLWLYWQPTEKLSLALTEAFQLKLRLLPQTRSLSEQQNAQTQAIFQTSQAFFPQSSGVKELSYGVVTPVAYNVALPASLPLGNYTLQACLVVAANEQPVFATPDNGSSAQECVSLPVRLN